MDKKENTDFLHKLARGDHQTFKCLFLEYFPKIKFFINHLVKNEMIAEELSQDVFTKLWINKEFIPEIKSLNSYIYKMAKNRSLEHLNHILLEKKHLINQLKNDKEEFEMEGLLYAKEIKQLINSTVQNMPKQRRTVFIMSREQNLKNKKIAEILDISPKTVENHLTLALNQIRETLKNANILTL